MYGGMDEMGVAAHQKRLVLRVRVTYSYNPKPNL
jgi:hypothetical protein